MTILNKEPIKGTVKDFANRNKVVKASCYYVLLNDSPIISALVVFNDNKDRGLGSKCLIGGIIGYLFNESEFKPYKKECRKNLREF